MPGPAEVEAPSTEASSSGPAARSTRSSGASPTSAALRVRPPSPLSTGRRIAVGVALVLVLVVAAVLVLQARSADGDQSPGARWSRRPPPRAAEMDGFGAAGPLGTVTGFGTWSTSGSPLSSTGGVLGSAEGTTVATVDAGSSDVLVYAQFIAAPQGSGVLLAVDPPGRSGIWFGVAGPDRWEVRSIDDAGSSTTLGEIQAPTTEVIVQASLRGGQLKALVHPASGDTQTLDLQVPGGTIAGTYVGITTGAPGAALDLFGYLALDAA